MVLLERQRRATKAARDELAAGAALSLYTFVQLAWRAIEPNQVFIGGWALAAMCRHLEAITRGDFLAMGLFNRLLMNVPPGMMKSLLVGVLWPAWEWGPMNMPFLRYLSTAFTDDLAIRDSRKMRDLVESDWYQEHWGDRVRLVRRAEDDFQNSAGGWRKAVAFSSLTGGRGDRVLVDDPHSTEMAESEAERKTALRIFRESLHSRLNDPAKSAIVIIMQRLHENDVSGAAIRLGLGYTHLMLPMEFEVQRACRTPIGFADPRSYEGELLFPERFSRATIERDRKVMTAYAIAGQWQQRPTPREGGMFKRIWFRRVTAAPMNCRWVRHFDLAATEEIYAQANGARTAGVLMGRDSGGGFYIAGCVKERVENVHPLILNTAMADRSKWPRYEVSLPQDPGQAGKVQKRALAALLNGFDVHFDLETGDKATRAAPFAAQCEVGNVALVIPPRPAGEPEPPWVEEYLDEVTNFPGGALKDQVDATSGAYARLLKSPRDQPTGQPMTGSIYQR